MHSQARLRKVHLQPNLTSLIDVVFLLLVFFLLATQLVQESRVEMALPAFDDRQSGELPRESRVILNVVPVERESEFGVAYQIEQRAFAGDGAGVNALASALRDLNDRQPGLRVLLRAARDEAYERVHPALQAVTLAGVHRVDLVTVPPEGELERVIRAGEAVGSDR